MLVRILHATFSRAAIRRTLPAAIVVGTLLTVVNSGARIADGDVDGAVLARVALTYLVPFANATYGFLTGVGAKDATPV